MSVVGRYYRGWVLSQCLGDNAGIWQSGDYTFPHISIISAPLCAWKIRGYILFKHVPTLLGNLERIS